MGIHRQLIRVYTKLGYRNDQAGICHGMTIRWLEACLLNEENIFFQRIADIISDDALVLSIDRVQKKKGLNLTQEDWALLDILAFFDSLHLFQNPNESSSLFQKNYNQMNIEAISLIASSDKILVSGGLIPINLSINNYSLHELMLTTFLNGISQTIDALVLPPEKTITLLLTEERHTIGLTYNTTAGWKCTSINRCLARQFNHKETSTLAEMIFKSFIFNDDSKHKTSININTILLTTKNDSYRPQLDDLFGRVKIQNNSWLTEETVLRGEKTGMVRMVAYYGYHSIITELVKYSVDLNQPIHPMGFTLAHISAQQGHDFIISKLAAHYAELDKTDFQGLTPTHWAAKEGHVPVLIELTKHSVDWNKQTKEGITPAFLAAQYNQIEALEQLIDLEADCTIPHITTVEKARELAISTEDDAIIVRMELYIEQKAPRRRSRFFDWSFFSCRNQVPQDATISVTPLEIAAIMGYQRIVNILSIGYKPGFSIG